MLSEIEVIKVDTFTLPTSGLTLTNPLTIVFPKSQSNLWFRPDFVTVKMASYFDTTNASVGILNVNCNFIRDNGILVSVPSMPITVSNTFCPNITHSYIDHSQLTFMVNYIDATVNPSATSYITLTLEFVKLKTPK